MRGVRRFRHGGVRVPAVLAGGLLAIAAGARGADRWEARAPMGVPRQEIGVAAVGQVLYAIGGLAGAMPSATVEAYDATADRWTTVAPLPAALHHVGAVGLDGKVYVVGGIATLAFTAVDTVFEYDPARDAWQSRAPLPTPRGAMGVAAVGGRIYAAGGLGADGASVADFAVYDPGRDAWTPLPPMPTARDHLAAAALGSTFYAVGGRTTALIGALEAFDPATGAWETGLARLPTPRGGLMAAPLRGRLFTFGGEGNPRTASGVFEETEVYDPATDRWTRLAPMPTPRHGTAADVIGDGIYVVGGATRAGLGVSGANEVFFPAAERALTAIRARLARLGRGRRRLLLQARLAEAAGDPSAAPFALRILTNGAPLLDLGLPAGALAANPRRTRWRHRGPTPGPDPGFVRVTLRRRGSALVTEISARATALASAPRTVTVALAFGNEVFCGPATLRGPRAGH